MIKFKELYELWRKDNLFDQAIKDSRTMLKNTSEMFEEAVKSLREKDNGEISDEVYKKDHEINLQMAACCTHCICFYRMHRNNYTGSCEQRWEW